MLLTCTETIDNTKKERNKQTENTNTKTLCNKKWFLEMQQGDWEGIPTQQKEVMYC